MNLSPPCPPTQPTNLTGTGVKLTQLKECDRVTLSTGMVFLDHGLYLFYRVQLLLHDCLVVVLFAACSLTFLAILNHFGLKVT